MRKILLCFVLTVSFVCLAGNGRYSDVTDSIGRLYSNADYYGVIDYSNELLQKHTSGSEACLRMFCYANAAQCYIKTDWPEKAKEYMDSVAVIMKRISVENPEDDLYAEGFYTYANTMVMYHIYDDIDYHEAIRYATMALDAARERNDVKQQILFGLNYSILNTQIQADYAYEGAEQLYNQAVRLGNRNLIFSAAQVCAWRFNSLGDNARSREFLRIAIEHLPESYMDASTVYADYAEALFATGNESEARRYYEKAMSVRTSGFSSSLLSVYLDYAYFLRETGDRDGAETIYLKGLAMMDSVGTRWNRKSFYYELYGLYKEEGRFREAMNYMESYMAESDSIAQERQKKDLLEMRIKYETAVKEKIIAEQNERISFILVIAILMIAVSAVLAIMYFHKRASYLALFRMYSDVLADKKAQQAGEEGGATEQIPEEENLQLYDRIFSEIERMMRDEHIYRRPGLTKEQAAAMIGTNRTYLAEAIKQHTGLSFVYYINSYRIQEAKEILSDPSNDTPMKAVIMEIGFRSSTTFYKLFSEVTGTTPQTYRNNRSNNA